MKYTEKELEQERWKPIFGYNGLYEVSDLGRVRSLKFGKVRVLRENKYKGGYFYVNLYRDGKLKHFLVHRLVAQAFIENDNIFNTQINHIDECKQNNKVSNLEYCDAQYNNTYNDINHRRNNPNYKYRKVKNLYNQNLTYEQNLEIFKANGFECSTHVISNIRKGLSLKGRSNWKRNEIKDLYNPNLSIKENLKVFKENGVECSRDTVIKLRKDLGLTKKYNRNQ